MSYEFEFRNLIGSATTVNLKATSIKVEDEERWKLKSYSATQCSFNSKVIIGNVLGQEIMSRRRAVSETRRIWKWRYDFLPRG